MRPSVIICGRGGRLCMLLGAMMLLAAVRSTTGPQVWAGSQNQADPQPGSSQLLVIQGRITGIQGTLATVKLPNGYPGGQGGHAQFVTAGPVFKVDVSHARIVLPDGKQIDKQPVAIGDRVLMVLIVPGSSSTEPGNAGPVYSASIVERVVPGDKIITH